MKHISPGISTPVITSPTTSSLEILSPLYISGSISVSGSITVGDTINVNNINFIRGAEFTSSWAYSASNAVKAGNASTIDINVFGSNVNSYLLMSNVVGTTGVAIGGDADLRYNTSTNVLTVSNISATTLTGSLQGTSSWATNALTASFLPVGTYQITSSWAVSSSQAITSSFARTSSFVNTLNQNVLITGSLTVGTGSIGPSENTLTLGARDNGSEGGQIGFNAPGGTYTSASYIDNWQNQFRILKGPNNGSNASLGVIDLQTGHFTLNPGSIIMPARPAFRVVGANTGGAADKGVNSILSGSLVTVDYNQGSYYNNTNGQFTCPLAGLYHIWYVGRTQNASLASVAILKNNGTVLTFWESNTNTGHFGTSAVVNLAANDIITAKVTAGTITFDTNDNWGAAFIG